MLKIGTIRRPTVLDIMHLAENARKDDKEESLLLSGKDMLDVFNSTEGIYRHCWAWVPKDKLACVYGVVPYAPKKGIIWMIATDEFDERRREALKFCRSEFEIIMKGYDYAFNYVHPNHKKAIKWLKWLGCDIIGEEPVGVDGEVFLKFEVVKNV